MVFDLHAHPGATFQKGRPEYLGDEAHRRTVAGMQAGELTGAFFSLVADGPADRTDAQRRGHARWIRQGGCGARTSDLQRAHREHAVAAYLACEGGEFLEGDAGRVDQLYDDGVRSLQLVHYVPTVLGDLQTQPSQHGGLSAAGKAVVKRLTAKGIVIDVAHA